MNSTTTYVEKLLVISVTLDIDNAPITNEVEVDLKQFNSFDEFLNLLSKKINYKIGNKNEIKIFYEGSWVNLIDLKSFYCFISTNLITCVQTRILIRGVKIKDNQMDFDLEGKKLGNNDATNSNRPNMKIYGFSSKKNTNNSKLKNYF